MKGNPIEKQFDRVALGYDFMDSIQNNNGFFIQRLPRNRKRALDVGCGSGILAEALSEQFDEVVGVDISGEMLALAAYKRSQPNIVYAKRDAAVLSPDDRFDCIVSRNTFHHIENIPALLEELKEMARPGGRIIILDCYCSVKTPSRMRNILWAFSGFLLDIFEHGPAAAWKILGFRLSKDWLDHLANDKFLSETVFKSLFGECLPGCRFEKEKCFLAAIWDQDSYRM
jgi:ubiquinone/menaquinone biosynthesis C-methylase UbiE